MEYGTSGVSSNHLAFMSGAAEELYARIGQLHELPSAVNHSQSSKHIDWAILTVGKPDFIFNDHNDSEPRKRLRVRERWLVEPSTRVPLAGVVKITSQEVIRGSNIIKPEYYKRTRFVDGGLHSTVTAVCDETNEFMPDASIFTHASFKVFRSGKVIGNKLPRSVDGKLVLDYAENYSAEAEILDAEEDLAVGLATAYDFESLLRDIDEFILYERGLSVVRAHYSV